MNTKDKFINKLLDDIHSVNPELSLKRQTEYNKAYAKQQGEVKECETCNDFGSGGTYPCTKCVDFSLHQPIMPIKQQAEVPTDVERIRIEDWLFKGIISSVRLFDKGELSKETLSKILTEYINGKGVVIHNNKSAEQQKRIIDLENGLREFKKAFEENGFTESARNVEQLLKDK